MSVRLKSRQHVTPGRCPERGMGIPFPGETMKMLRLICVCALILGAAVTAATADDIPNLVGKWTGTFTGGVRQGGGQLTPTDAVPRFVHPGDREYTLTIEKQDGRGVGGTWSSVLGAEKAHGVIRLDNKTVLMDDEDSVLHGTLLSP